VTITAKTYFGETAFGSVSTNVAIAAGQVADVTFVGVPGALSYNVYVGTNTPAARATYFLYKTDQGGIKLTIQGALPTTVNPPAADSGTFSTTDYEGILSVLTGWASTNSVYPPSAQTGLTGGWAGGYVNQNVGSRLKVSVLEDALSALWDNTTSAGVTNAGQGGFRANPSELIVEGYDARNFADSVLGQAAGQTAYELFIDQSQIGNITAGAAISQFQNPITRDVLRLMVHPWLRQGTALLMSYTMPLSFSNVSNIWENTMVQDYLSVSWPVIDASFRYSVFFYGALVCYGSMYNGILGGLQKTDTTPYS
jgi:hypothetical protein